MELLARNLLVFRDEDIAAKCEGQCELAYVDCTLGCSNTECLIECGRALTDCTLGLRFDPSNTIDDFNKEYSILNNLFSKIVHVMLTAQMAVMVAPIRFVSVVIIHRLRMKIICKNAKRKKVLILANALLIAKTMNLVRNPVLLCSKNSMISAHVK